MPRKSRQFPKTIGGSRPIKYEIFYLIIYLKQQNQQRSYYILNFIRICRKTNGDGSLQVATTFFSSREAKYSDTQQIFPNFVPVLVLNLK
jgi:hypothetical protein